MSEPHGLPRRIGIGGALLLAFNGAIGASIFALPGMLAADFGTSAPWLFPLVGIASLLIAIPFCRSVAAFPESGGPATYGRVFGTLAGFELGWIYYIARATAFAANLNVLISYLARWWGAADGGATRIALLLAFVAAFTAINVTGVKSAMRVLGGLTLLKTIPLLLLAAAALALAGAPAPGPLPPVTEIEAGVLLVFYAFVGFENATVTAGETKDPNRTLPRALLGTIGTVALLYFFVQLAFVAVFPNGVEEGADAPLLALGEWLMGPVGALLIGVTAIFSTAGNLHSNMAATPRVTFSMAERGELPTWLAKVHSGFDTPVASILFFAALVAALAVSGSFVWLAVISTLARMIVYSVTILALPGAPARPAHISPSHWLLASIGVLVCIVVAAQADAKAWLTLGALAAAGLLLYLLARFFRSTEA
ncbi:APC family permease [Sphingomonas sp. SM33]|uniref:Arginine/agmatine antiporter n=1 Tax=Sphingomonas telluris TaxID=2907998 RepID=A0ABS9VQR5_9SPHN|nr:APC family permease [Sphingomonas telluris]MCH8617325.1 APC family permease [Sphingomonas telluris]